MSKSIAALRQVDIYSLMLFVLYQLKGVPEYATLSELVYVLDKDNLFKLLDYFGGTTIKIPTKEELQIVINSLLVYQYTKIEGLSLNSALARLEDIDATQTREIKSLYSKLCEVMDQFYVE